MPLALLAMTDERRKALWVPEIAASGQKTPLLAMTNRGTCGLSGTVIANTSRPRHCEGHGSGPWQPPRADSRVLLIRHCEPAQAGVAISLLLPQKFCHCKVPRTRSNLYFTKIKITKKDSGGEINLPMPRLLLYRYIYHSGKYYICKANSYIHPFFCKLC